MFNFHSLVEINMHLALRITEILAVILNGLPKPDVYHCALACKTWYSTALPLLWNYLEKLLPLMNLLGPVHYEGARWVS